MSTLKYKAKDRYNVGWTDLQRGAFGESKFYTVFEAVLSMNKGLGDTDTDVLRNLWLATFGDAPVSHGAMCEHLDTDDDIFWVAHELWRRHQIVAVEMKFHDRTEIFYGYHLTVQSKWK